MESGTGGTVALSANWLEPVNVMSNASVSGSTLTGGASCTIATNSCCGTYWYYQPWSGYGDSRTTAKITLKHQEVERLRSAAKRDAKLKAILQKFTPLIEVEVEF